MVLNITGIMTTKHNKYPIRLYGDDLKLLISLLMNEQERQSILNRLFEITVFGNEPNHKRENLILARTHVKTYSFDSAIKYAKQFVKNNDIFSYNAIEIKEIID